MAWTVEQQAKSGLGQIVWLKVAGPFAAKAEADMIAGRMEARRGLLVRVVKQAQP